MLAPSAVHFYHLWLGGSWQQIAAEHFATLRESSFPGDVRVGLVGSPDDREDARDWLRRQPVECCVVTEALTGFEEVTLRTLRYAVRTLPNDTSVLYAHAKGAFHPSKANTQWRKKMTAYLAGSWQDRVAELAVHDLSAWHWLSPGVYTSQGQTFNVSDPMAAGNFWWARADYLKGLPYLPSRLIEDERMKAETWVGQDSPAVAFFSDQWPTVTVERTWRQVVTNGIAQNQWIAVD